MPTSPGSSRSIKSTNTSASRPSPKRKKRPTVSGNQSIRAPSGSSSVATTGSKRSVATNNKSNKKKNGSSSSVKKHQPNSTNNNNNKGSNSSQSHQRGVSYTYAGVDHDVEDNKSSRQTKDEYEERDEERDRRRTVCGIVICCLCCIVLAIILILLFVVFDVHKRNPDQQNNGRRPIEGPTSSPAPVIQTRPPATLAPAPTLPPVTVVRPPTSDGTTRPPMMGNGPPSTTPAPNPQPTNPPVTNPTSIVEPTNSQYVLFPFADTTIHQNGFDMREAFGSDDSWLVQNGPRGSNQIPDTFALIAFDLNELPNSASNFDSAILQIFHVQPGPEVNRGPATLSISRLPASNYAIETLHGGFYSPPDVNDRAIGPNFSVSTSDELLQIDVTNILKASGFNNQVLLLIENNGPEQGENEYGDRFYSRETLDPPQLIVQY